jgi:hypothetical protein
MFCPLFVIPADAGIHGCGRLMVMRHRERRVSVDPGVRRDDERSHQKRYVTAILPQGIDVPREPGL